MVPPDLRPEKVEIKEKRSSREEFLQRFSGFVTLLSDLEDGLPPSGSQRLGQISEVLTKYLGTETRELPSEEGQLFRVTYELWCLKKDIPGASDIPEFREFIKGKGVQEMSVELGGPIAVAKTTLSNFLASEIGARTESERFKLSENLFLSKAYEDLGYMLRTQVKFLLDNIVVGLRGKFCEGRWVRDTSNWSDIFIFMEWRKRAGLVTEEEHKTYMNLVRLLEPLIHRPDLLILLLPNSVENLWVGLQKRIEDNPQERSMEKAVSLQDLEVSIQATKDASRTLQDDFGIQMYVLEIDPVEVYREPSLRYAAVYQIREKLGLLKELLLKDPDKVASKIVGIFASTREPQIVFVHSKSMFTGKTTTLNLVAEKIGVEKVVTFQPASAIRYGEEHVNNMIDRDGRKIPAYTIRSNNLRNILSEIESRGITPEESPFVFIDEVMLFFENDAGEAIRTLEELRNKGFNVLCNGIDYTFQEEPFTFSHHLIARALMGSSWHEVELATRCKYCERQAAGSRRLKANGEIAHYEDTTFEAGDNYEPVCCDEHKSCEGQPSNFQRRRLPSEALLIPPWKRRPLKRVPKSEEIELHEFTRVTQVATGHIKGIVDEFLGSGDFGVARKKIISLFSELTASGLAVTPVNLAVIFTDSLMSLEGEHLYPVIVAQSEELGIRPQENFGYPRLQAMSCLIQIIENIDFLEELKG